MKSFLGKYYLSPRVSTKKVLRIANGKRNIVILALLYYEAKDITTALFFASSRAGEHYVYP